MPIFGYDTVGASNTNSLGRGYGHGNASHQHTAGATDTITSLHLYTRNIGDTADVGVYDMGVGSTENGATLVASATITATSDTAQWEEVAVNIPLTPGNNYFLAYASSNGIRRYFDTGVAGDSTEDQVATAGALQATWTENSTDTEIVSLYATYSDGTPARAITNIDGDNDVQAGQTNVTIVTVDLDASPTTQIATLDGRPLTVNSWSATAVDVSIPLHVNLEWGSTTNQLALTDDTGTVTLDNVTLSTPTGWQTVTYNGTAPDPVATESFYEHAQTDVNVGNFTMDTNDILAWETQVGLTIDAQTIPTVVPPVTTTGDYKIWDTSASSWTSVSDFTITDGGDIGATQPISASVTATATAIATLVQKLPIAIAASVTATAHAILRMPAATFMNENEALVGFFREQTGLNTYSLNELAIAYYNQIASTDQAAFNDAQRGAQDVAGFNGLGPTDWRNFL